MLIKIRITIFEKKLKAILNGGFYVARTGNIAVFDGEGATSTGYGEGGGGPYVAVFGLYCQSRVAREFRLWYSLAPSLAFSTVVQLEHRSTINRQFAPLVMKEVGADISKRIV